MNAWGISDKGKVRKQNQDVFFMYIEQARDLAACIVCDGMGGAKAGDIASRTAAEGFMSAIMPLLQPGQSGAELSSAVTVAVEKANRMVWEQAQAEPAWTGMGTTLVAFALQGGGAVVANAGDSRAYLISRGEIRRITEDHSLVGDLVRRGELTAEEARRHPGRNIITRALGTEASLESDIFQVKVKTGDCILLCSDGLTNMVSEEELLREISAPQRDSCCDRLLKLALDRGAPDNVTAVLFER